MKRFFLLLLFSLTLLTQVKSLTLTSEVSALETPANSSVMIINETVYTWYGDFIVNETDTVIIENCNFTVENGLIYVYGVLNVTNSTIWMRNVSLKYKNIYVSGNFTMSNSKILGNNIIICDANSNVQILNSPSPTTRLDARRGGNAYVYNSSLRLVMTYGNVRLLNSNISEIFYFFRTSSNFFISDSCINHMCLLELEYYGDLELHKGFIESLTIYSSVYSANFTLSHSIVEEWYIHCSWFEGKFYDSTIGTLDFGIDPNWSGNLTLTSGHVEYLELNCSSPHFIIENSTVNEWRISIWGNTSIEIVDSENVDLDILESARVFIMNSYVLYICAYEDFSGSILATNTTINSFNIRFYDCSSNLSLKEGFYEFFNIYLPEHECNMTLVNSTVEHWYIQAGINSTLNIVDSNLTKDLIGWCPYNLHIVSNSSCSVYDSNIEVIFCSGSAPYYQLYPTLTIVNCTVKTLYVYNGANVTCINSTINMLITDPINVNLINSKILLALDFSIEITHEDSVATQFMDECHPSLPKDVARFSQYVNITTAYGDYFETQVRIYYDEAKIKAGVDENWLQMYYLDESSTWRLCQVQGVNSAENYVWANVTHLSVFVLGIRVTCTPWEVVIVNEYTIDRYGITIRCMVGYMKRTCNLPGYCITYRPWKVCDIS